VVDVCTEAAPSMVHWGVVIEDPGAVFREINSDGQGAIEFDEFAFWAIENNLDVDGARDADTDALTGVKAKRVKHSGPAVRMTKAQRLQAQITRTKANKQKPRKSKQDFKVPSSGTDARRNSIQSGQHP